MALRARAPKPKAGRPQAAGARRTAGARRAGAKAKRRARAPEGAAAASTTAGARRVGGVALAPGRRAFGGLGTLLRRPVRCGQWPGVAAAVFVEGRPRLLEEAGYADLEARAPMTSRSLVRLYSMTKCVVAAAVLQLLDEGALGLDDALSDHIPAFREMQVILEGQDGLPGRLVPARRPITIRHLLTHTSGISCGLSPGLDGPKHRGPRERAWCCRYSPLVDGIDRGEFRNLGEWVAELARLPLQCHPGQDYGYGYSYDILGHLVELKTGYGLEKVLRRRIFAPLGMSDTCFSLGAGASRRLSVLYRRTKSAGFGSDGRRMRLVRVDPPRGAPSRWARPCRVPSGGGALSSLEGGLLSTLEDYSRFLLAVTAGGAHPATGARILSPAAAEAMLSDQTLRLRPRPPAAASPYGDRGLGLSCLGEVQRRGAPCWGEWFDGVPQVRQWGGAASTLFKFDPNGGRPILVVVMTQVLPQESGATITAVLRRAREIVGGPGRQAGA